MKEVLTLSHEVGITRKIKKAKLNTNRCVDVEFEETKIVMVDNQPVEMVGIVPYKGTNIVHQDLVDAFDMLRAHLAFLTEMRECVDITLHDLDQNEDLIELFHVEQFEINGTGEPEGIKIAGHKRLKSGHLLPLKPAFFAKFIDDSEDAYKYTDELDGTHTHLDEELKLYMNGKLAPAAQMSLFGDDDEPE